MRRSSGKAQRPVTFDDDPYDDALNADLFEEEPFASLPPRESTRRGRRSSNQERRAPSARPAATQQLGGMLSAARPDTRLVAGTIGVVLVSLVIMAATVAGRASAMPDWFPIHLNAEGAPDRFGTPATLWRIPLMAGMMTVMSVTVGWYVMKHDAFAARFAIVSTLLIHAMCWIALANLVW